MTAPQVAVVVTAHDQERYVAEAARSAVGQDGVEVEVVVVDDGSTDGTARAARAVAGASVVVRENGGVAAARNTGADATTAPVLCFLDGDDRLRPGALVRGLAHLAGSAFAFGRSQLVDADGRALPTAVRPPVAPTRLYEELLREPWVVPQGCLLVRRDALDRVGRFDAGLTGGGEDLDLYLRLARVLPGVDHDDLVCDYRLHPANMTKGYRALLAANAQVLAAQATWTAGDPALERARRQGLAHLHRVYGTKAALAEAVGALRTGDGVVRAAGRAVAAVAAHPAYSARLVSTSLRRAGRRR